MTKKLIYSLSVFAFSLCSFAQNWETVGTEKFTGGDVQYSSMDVYNGTPYIAFKDLSKSSKCSVMRFNGTNWVYVGSQGFTSGIAREQSLSIDQQTGNVYLHYSDATNNGKSVVSKYNDNTGNWESLNNGYASGQQNFYCQLKTDNGIPHLVYGGYQAVLKKFENNTWNAIPGPIISIAQAWYTRLAFDGNTKYVVYSDKSVNSRATVAKITTNSLTTVGDTFGFTVGGVAYTDIGVANSVPYISFQDSLSGRKISVMKFNGTTWENVGNAGISGGNVTQTRISFHNSIPYISYQDGNDGKLYVKRFTGTNWETVGSTIADGDIYLCDMVINNDDIFVSYKGTGSVNGKLTVKKYSIVPLSLETNKSNAVRLFPNPVTHVLNLEIDDKEIININLIDALGKIIYTVPNTKNSIDVSSLNNGFYFVKINTTEGNFTKSFLKE